MSLQLPAMDNANLKPVSTIVGNCPDCSGYVRLPMEVRPDVMVRCPHCTQTFPVARILAQIPELEIVAPMRPESITPVADRESITRPVVVDRKKFQVPHQLLSGAKKRRKRQPDSSEQVTAGPNPPTEMDSTEIAVADGEHVTVSDSDSSLDVMIQPDATAKPSARGTSSSSRRPEALSPEYARRVRVHSSQRHRRMKEVNRDPSFEIAKVVFGGLLAFPVAYLILLWVIGQDPLNLAPSLSKSVPFVVPKKMREEKASLRSKEKDKREANSAKDDEPETAAQMPDLKAEQEPDSPLSSPISGLAIPVPSKAESPQPVLDVAPSDKK